MRQTITISVDSGRHRLRPEEVVRALIDVPATLRSIDSNMWAVGKPRLEWYVEAASKNSPFRLVLAAVVMISSSTVPDVAGVFLGGLRQLASSDAGRPAHWADEDLKRVAKWRDFMKARAAVQVQFQTDDGTVEVTSAMVRHAKKLLNPADRDDAPRLYGSISGRVRKVEVDQGDRRRTVSKFQLIDDATGVFVVCRFDPVRAKHIRATDRVVAYGDLTIQPDGTPRSMAVEDFRVLAEKPPSLRDLHALGVNITNGEDAADYIDRIRGESD